jgi:2',3'-cyclic-nucleotide 2'-phosphodiesterase (5'-nucleotidase family)
MLLCSEIASVGGEAISGMTILITADGKLLDVKVGGRSVDRSRSYRVATSDYLSQGNDRMTALASGTEREIMSNTTIRDLMIKYIKSLAAEGRALSAECDGRITIKE